MNLTQGNHKLGLENVYERENPISKININIRVAGLSLFHGSKPKFQCIHRFRSGFALIRFLHGSISEHTLYRV